MTNRRNHWLVPLLSLCTTALIFLWLWNRTEIHFALGDDFYLARAFAGEVGGVAETFNAHIHPIFVWLLHGLTLIFPGIWWFSWLQMALLFLGSFGVIHGLLRAAERLNAPLWGGWLCAMLYIFAMTAEFSTTFTFTTTAAVLCGGAVCLLGGVDLAKPSAGVCLPVLGSGALLWCAYMLRGMAALPGAVFWVGLFLCRLLFNTAAPGAERFAPAPALRGAGIVLLTAALLVGVQSLNTALTPEKDYLEFIDATVVPMDYGGLDAATPETLAAIGWTEKETALVRSWYFMDENMSAANFRLLESDALNQPAPPVADRLQTALLRIRSLIAKTPAARDFLLIMLSLCASAFLAACFSPKRCLWLFLAPVGCGLVTVLLLGYLGWEGRLPMRAAATVLLPAAAMALVLAAEALPALSPRPRTRALHVCALPSCAALICGLVFVLSAGTAAFSTYYNPHHGNPDHCVYARVERYVQAQESILFVGDRTLGVDVRPFPDRSAGAPVNLLPMWGGWNNHSQGYRAAFERAGLQHDHFTVTAFLGNNVRLVTGSEGVSMEFLAYLEEQAGGSVTPVAEHEGDGFAVYRFERAAN